MAFRYLSVDMYNKWRFNRFNTFPEIFKMEVIRARKMREEEGEWFQLGVRMTHMDLETKKPVEKVHTIERKVGEPYGV